MYTVCSILKCTVEAYTRESVLLFASVALVTLLLVFAPGIVLALPNAIFG